MVTLYIIKQNVCLNFCIQSIVLKPRLSGSNVSGESTPEDGREEKEDTTRVNTAIFYSITSTQKGVKIINFVTIVIVRV